MQAAERDLDLEIHRGAEARSAGLKRPLGLWDLVLMQFLCVVSTTWLGVAGKLGSSHGAFWIAAMLLFHVPLAAVVIHLSRQMPLEGGLYQWSKRAFGERAAFMVGWNLWLFSILSTGLVGLQVSTYVSYAFGPSTAWMAENPWFNTGASAAIVIVLAVLTIVGLGAARWMHNAGGVALALTCAGLLVLPLAALVRGNLHSYPLVPNEMPDLSLVNLSILGRMGFGAFCGFEYTAILAGECREPRAIGRSVLIASAGVAVVYVFGTATVLAFVPPGDIDLVSPIAQALHLGLASLGVATHVVPIVIFVLLGCSLAGASVNFTSTTRLPMVAGWDRMLPGWFGRLHPRTGTPVNAILLTAMVTLAVAIVSLLGVRHQEAYQVLLSAALVFYALGYLVMFSIPLFRAGVTGLRSPWWLRGAAACGLLMTLLYLFTAIVPLVEVQSTGGFSGRIVGVVAGGNVAGAALLVIARRRTRR